MGTQRIQKPSAAVREGNAIANNISSFGQSIGDDLKGLFDKNQREANKIIKEARDEAAKREAKASAKAFRKEAKATAKAIKDGTYKEAEVVAETAAKRGVFAKSARAGFALVEQPISWAMKPVKWLTGAAAKNPRTALVVAGVAGALGVGNMIARNKSAQMAAQVDAMEAMAAEPQASYPMYKNNPEASQAFIDARIAQDRAAGAASSQTEMLAARQPIQAPEAAGAGPSV